MPSSKSAERASEQEEEIEREDGRCGTLPESLTLNAGCSFYHGASVAPQSGNEDGATRRMMGLSSYVGSLPTQPTHRGLK